MTSRMARWKLWTVGIAACIGTTGLVALLTRAPASQPLAGVAFQQKFSPVSKRQEFAPVPAIPPASRSTASLHGFLAVFVDRQASTARLPPDLMQRLPVTCSAEELAAIEGVLLDGQDDDSVRNEAANLLRRQHDSSLNLLLLRILDRTAERPRFRSFAAQHLGVSLMEDPANDVIARRLTLTLRDADRSVRREGLFALAQIRDASAIQAVRNALTDPSWSIDRDLCIRLAAELDLRDQVGVIREELRAPAPAVRISALRALAAWRDLASSDAFRQAAESSNPEIRAAGQYAQLCLQNLTESEGH